MPPALTRILLLCETVLATTSADAAPKLVQPHRSVAIDGFGHAIEDAVKALSHRHNEPQEAALAETHQKTILKAGIIATPDQTYKNIWKYLRQIRKALKQQPIAMAQREDDSAQVVENGTEPKTKVINIIVKPHKQNKTGLLKMLKQEMDDLDLKQRSKFARKVASLLMKKLDMTPTNETDSKESDEDKSVPTEFRFSIGSLRALLNRLDGKPTTTSPPNEDNSTDNEEEELKAATKKAKKLLAKLEVKRLKNASDAAESALNNQQESKSKAKPHSRKGKGSKGDTNTLKEILEHLSTTTDGVIDSDAG